MPIAPEHLISDDIELLHRNAHPTFIVNGRVTSQAFLLKNEDEGQLSVQQNTKANPKVAYERYIATGFASGGVWSITVAECNQLELKVYDDPLPNDDSHAVIDLTRFGSKQARKITDKLAVKARERDCQYAPSEE